MTNHTLLIALLLAVVANSQNLVPNPSFEETNSCEYQHSRFKYQVNGWTTPNLGTSDIFNGCNTRSTTGVPNNFVGSQEAHHGDNYAGIYAVTVGYEKMPHFSEYIEVQLISSLIEKEFYQLSFFVSLAEASDFGVCGLGAILSENKIKANTPLTLRPENLSSFGIENYKILEQDCDKKIDDKLSWMKVSYSFRADGYERFLIIGHFKDNEVTLELSNVDDPRLNKHAYYYVDSVSLERIEEQQIELIEDDVYKLPIITFDHDSAVIKDSEYTKLNQLAAHLKMQKDCVLHIRGSASENGTDERNAKLSRERARAVKQYLESLGLESLILVVENLDGIKQSSPVEQSADLKRVEFKIICK